MAKSSTGYTRLTRNTAGLGSYSSLWLGDDHLMIVRSTGYHETYSRMQLGEMKAIFLTASDRRMWWGIFWGVFLAIPVVVLVATLTNRDTPIFSAVFTVIGGVGLLWNHLLGEGCRAYVLTGVQTAELPALIRTRKARRVVAQLQPMIAAAQANLASVPPMPTGG